MAADKGFRVDLEVLAGSAAQVAAVGEDLATAHLLSDNRIAAAQPGWVGSSAAALDSKTAAWLETSRGLLARVGDHATELTNDAIGFAARERANAEALRAADSA
jgi:uncharacterized protein YukE